MIEIVRERTLDVPVSQIWDLIEPIEQLPEWFVGADTAVSLGGVGLGRRQRVSGHWGSRRFEIDQLVTVYEPQQGLGWRHEAERLDGQPAPAISRQTEFEVRLEVLDRGTRVVMTSRQLPGNILKAVLVRLIAAPRISRMMEGSLDKLTRLLGRAT